MSLRDTITQLREIVAYTMAYAPDAFPVRDYLPPDSQMSLERAFSEINGHLDSVASSLGETSQLLSCRQSVASSLRYYTAGDKDHGFLALQDAYHVLGQLSSL